MLSRTTQRKVNWVLWYWTFMTVLVVFQQGGILGIFKAQSGSHIASIFGRDSALGNDAVGTTPEEFAATLKKDRERWTPVIKASGFKAE